MAYYIAVARFGTP